MQPILRTDRKNAGGAGGFARDAIRELIFEARRDCKTENICRYSLLSGMQTVDPLRFHHGTALRTMFVDPRRGREYL